MKKIYVSRIVRARGFKHASGHYALGAVKRVARQSSAENKHSDADAREVASFMPLGINARVLRWPQL